MDFDQNVLIFGRRFLDVLELKNFRRSEFCVKNRFHWNTASNN